METESNAFMDNLLAYFKDVQAQAIQFAKARLRGIENAFN